MAASEAKKRAKPNRRKRQTSLTLDQAIWDRLKEIESKTAAKPSAIANRILSQGLDIQPAKEP